MITLYNVVSSDGFIARQDGSEDFIPDDLWPTTLEFIKQFDVLIMGRKTYDAIQNYDKELLRPFESLNIKKVVVTQNAELQTKPGYIVVSSPEEALAFDTNILVSSGPTLNNYFLEKKWVNKVVLHMVNASIAEGILPFKSEFKEKLNLVAETQRGHARELLFEVTG